MTTTNHTTDATRLDALLVEADEYVVVFRETAALRTATNIVRRLRDELRASLARESEGREDTERLDWLIAQTRGKTETATFVRDQRGAMLYVILWMTDGMFFDRDAIDRGMDAEAARLTEKREGGS